MRPSTVAPWTWTRKELQGTGAQADVAVWDPAAGKAVFLHKIIISSSADADVQLTEGADASGTRIVDVLIPDGATSKPFVLEFPFEAPYKLAADAIVNITTDTGNVKVVLYGNEF